MAIILTDIIPTPLFIDLRYMTDLRNLNAVEVDELLKLLPKFTVN